MFKEQKYICTQTHKRTLLGDWDFIEGKIYYVKFSFKRIKIYTDTHLPITISKKFLETRFKKV